MMNRMTFCLLAAAGTLMQAADLAGTYSLRNVREAGSELLLKPNGTFEYMFAYGAADYWAKGTWRPGNGGIILTSAPDNGDKPFRVVRSSAAASPAVRVRVVGPGPGGRGVPNIDVVLIAAKGKTPARTDSEGIALFEKTPGIRAVEFEIPVYSFQSGPIDVNAAHNDFTFEINGEAITQIRFKDERLTIEKGVLVMKSWGGGDQTLRYAKGE